MEAILLFVIIMLLFAKDDAEEKRMEQYITRLERKLEHIITGINCVNKNRR